MKKNNLINQVKERAGAPLLELSNFPDKASLNEAILQEREWEFWGEAKGRQD
ncbi:MAG: RagB/SusD family nutrient uptake outer membrane protein, partial [Candidatus Cyclobacteriaceae bacterium M3_2C_046]